MLDVRKFYQVEWFVIHLTLDVWSGHGMVDKGVGFGRDRFWVRISQSQFSLPIALCYTHLLKTYNTRFLHQCIKAWKFFLSEVGVEYRALWFVFIKINIKLYLFSILHLVDNAIFKTRICHTQCANIIVSCNQRCRYGV